MGHTTNKSQSKSQNNRELYTLPNTESGLTLAFHTTLGLRKAGFKTRLAERVFQHSTRFEVVTVVATYPTRSSRKERGCELK